MLITEAIQSACCVAKSFQLSTSGVWAADTLTEAVDAAIEGCQAVDEVQRHLLTEAAVIKAEQEGGDDDDNENDAGDVSNCTTTSAYTNVA